MTARSIPYILLPFLLLIPLSSQGQELNCTVLINDDQLEGSSFTYVSELGPRIEEYLNDHRWTDTPYLEEERIECRFQIILQEATSGFSFAAQAVINVRRPIYGTTIQTSSVIFSDNTWSFNYPQGRALIHDELLFDELTGFLDYYANLIIGYDMDSFSPLGGTPYFQQAQSIINLAQTTSAIGWNRLSNNRRNRVTLISDLLNSSYAPLREAFYRYHRLGLDLFLTDETEARENIVGALITIRDNKRRVTGNYPFDIFFDTKSREIAGIFREAPATVRLNAYNILSETDQAHLSDYSSLGN